MDGGSALAGAPGKTLANATPPLGNTTAWTYDPLGRAVGETNELLASRLFEYHANGNRTLAGYVTGDNNQLLSDGVYLYESAL